MQGYMGAILRVNLSNGTIAKETLKEELIYRFVGGRGLNAKILYDEIRPGTDPLGPDNKLVIGAGPSNGTVVPGSCRFTVSSKSPMTGFIGDSNAGGYFGASLKYAGYDAIIVEGQAEEPVYLWIDDDNVEIKSAKHLWGKKTKDTKRAILRENRDGDISVICIGPGGENLVRFSNLISDMGRGLGRTGQGAVFGSKKLKAVAVRGSKGVKVAHSAELEKAVRKMNKAWVSTPEAQARLKSRARFGPAEGWDWYSKYAMWAFKNYQGGGSWVNMKEPLDNYFVKQKACFSCPAGCNHMFVVTDGLYAGAYGEGLELTTIDFGPKIGNQDMDFLVYLHDLLDGYGLDYFELTALISFATECFEKGILTKQDTDGLEFTWGNADAALGLIEKIVQKKGFGLVFAEGLKRASETIGRGSEKYAMQVKGQTIPPRDPRTSKGWGLGYAVASRGPCHMRAVIPETHPKDMWDTSVHNILEKYHEPPNNLLEEGKGELTKWYEDLVAFKNCLQICYYSIYPWMTPSGSETKALANLYYLVTGISIGDEELLRIGERVNNVERAFNIREGLVRADDTLPERFMKEPYPEGPAKGQVINLEPMIDEYYEFRGWDKVTGFPSKAKLLELQLDDVVSELQTMGRLAS